MKNTTTVTHPDGTVSKRTSKSMIYTHAIQVSPADPYILAEHLTRTADALGAEAKALREAADSGQITIQPRGFQYGDADRLHSHQATLQGTDGRVFTWCGRTGDTMTHPYPYPAPGVVANVEQSLRALRADARRRADNCEAIARQQREQARDVIVAGAPVGVWTVERWSTRRDLADKALSSFRHLAERGHQVRVVEVDAPKVTPAPVAVDPAQDCEDTCCTEAAAQDVEADTTWDTPVPELEDTDADLAALGAEVQDAERQVWQKANPDARLHFYNNPGAAHWVAVCVGGPVCAIWRSTGHATEQGARVAYEGHRAGHGSAPQEAVRTGTQVEVPRLQAGDTVTIHRGTDLRVVLDVDPGLDLVRVGTVDPSAEWRAWWVPTDLVHRVPPVPVQWGTVVELPDGRRFAIVADGEEGDNPYLGRTR